MNRYEKKVVNVNDMDTLLDRVNLIDIREPFEVIRGTLNGAKNIPMGDLLNSPEKYLNKEDEYYILCQSGNRSSRAVSMLNSLGYKAINVGGGMGSYRGTKVK